MILLHKETINIKGFPVDICTDGYGGLYVVSKEPQFCITEKEASRQELIQTAQNTINAWERWSGTNQRG